MYSVVDAASSPTAPAPARPPAITLLALTIGVFLVTLNVTVVTVTLPDIQRSLHARPDELEWVIDAYNLRQLPHALHVTATRRAPKWIRRAPQAD